ncbi:membrane-bound lytic murein transglycosylase D [Vibrio cholerae]|uniref:hypothetical protein n=1 Tax=Vibrio cholerae TaxID=666 RepID=UPI00030D2605|nr:membrane-bound lytic murein transglycosylase D [Vibrio cholerae]
MRVKFSWVLALLLVGCQSPQPVDTTTSDDQAVNPPTQSATVKKSVSRKRLQLCLLAKRRV